MSEQRTVATTEMARLGAEEPPNHLSAPCQPKVKTGIRQLVKGDAGPLLHHAASTSDGVVVVDAGRSQEPATLQIAGPT